MDARRFDVLTRVVSAAGPRRVLFGACTALPLLGGVFGRLVTEDAGARDRRRRRKQRHKRRHSRDNRKHEGCQRKSLAKICAGRCGTVTNRKSCGKPVECGATCPDTTTVCCGGLCQTQADLNAACPTTDTPGFLKFENGAMRCASQQVEACTCLDAAYFNCAPGTVCKPNGNTIMCDLPSGT
jgi:hypothetical protein